MQVTALALVIALASPLHATPAPKPDGGTAYPVRPDWSTAPQGQRVLPRVETTQPLDNAKRVEIKYGPYNVPAGKSMDKFGILAESPCTNCYVTAIQATTRWENGSEVLTSDGIWMHHCLMMSTTRMSSKSPYGPGVLWSGGNERPTLRLNTMFKYGIDWPRNFNFALNYMSELSYDADVNLAITYEFIEKDQPEARGYRDAYLIWNTISTPAYQKGSYEHTSSPWTVPKSGVLLYGVGHMHDGGTHVDLYINDQLACQSNMFYAQRAGYQSGPPGTKNSGGHGHKRRDVTAASAPADGPAHFGGTHISDPGQCTNFGRVQKGDKMYIKAYYDTERFGVMSHAGEMEEQMGILRVFIGPD